MAKIFGITGLVSGKLGGAVYAIRNGQQIARQYNPSPAQPKTAKQTEQQAKLKLLSQLSAVLGPVIAIRRVGAKTPRNLFTRANYPLVSYAEDMANINLNRVQITKSVVGMLPFNADRTSGTSVAVRLDADAGSNFDKVVYVELAKGTDNSLRLMDSVVVSDGGADGLFAGLLKYTESAVVILAYGIRENTAAARAAFGNLTANAAEVIAKLVVTRAVNDYDVTLTETLGLTMAVGENTGDSENFERATITLTASGSGNVTGGGRYPVGTQITIHATPVGDAEFVGWYDVNDPTNPVSTYANFTFVVTEDVSMVARFRSGTSVPIEVVGSRTVLTINNQAYANGSTIDLELPATINYSMQEVSGYDYNAAVFAGQPTPAESKNTRTGTLNVPRGATKLYFSAYNPED